MWGRKNLPDSELDIMLAVWHSRGPATAPAILEALEKPLTASALHSYLKRLEEKGLEKLYEGSLKTFAAALWDGGKLSAAQVSELRDYLDELERGEK